MMPRACISCGRPLPTTPHAPWCPRGRTPMTPARTHYKDQHGYAHQQRRHRMVTPTATCAYYHMGGCGGPLQVDYIIPISLGGQATDENAQVLCARHNIGKGGKNRLRQG